MSDLAQHAAALEMRANRLRLPLFSPLLYTLKQHIRGVVLDWKRGTRANGSSGRINRLC